MKMSGGIKEDGLVVGNAYDKYGSKNPIVRWVMDGFHTSLSDFVNKVSPASILELGCGEGYWVIQWNLGGIQARGSDISQQIITIAKKNARDACISTEIFSQKNIYDITPEHDVADLIVCCEVLEHLDDPHAGLVALQKVVSEHLIIRGVNRE